MMPTLPNAIICDIDGTLAHGIYVTRKPYEWDKVDSDTIDNVVADILAASAAFMHADIILVSGRDESCRGLTEDWLDRYGIVYDKLFMRPEGDNIQDDILKERIYLNEIKPYWNVLFVMDDRKRVVDKWRAMDLKVLQVAAGEF